MANALNTTTLLSLDRFAQLMGIHPLLFNQVIIPGVTDQFDCGVLVQNSWQAADSIGREEIAEAIASAENDIFSLLGYKTLANFESEEIDFPRVYRPEMWGVNRDIRGYNTPVKARWGYLVEPGAPLKTLIQLGASVVYTSTGKAASYNDKATVGATLPAAVTDPQDVRIYHPGFSGQDEYEIRPISVSISGGIATIICNREQLVKISLLESYDRPDPSINGIIDANFETTVDVYAVQADVTNQAQFIWRKLENCLCGFGTDDVNCAACNLVSKGGCVSFSNIKLGTFSVQPSTWDPVNSVYNRDSLYACRAPDRVIINYRAGLRDNTYLNSKVRMNYGWEVAIARLAISRLDREFTSCNNIQEIVRYWSEDVAMTVSSSGRTASSKMTNFMLNCPWGTSRGALFAYRKVFQERLGV